MSNAYEKMKHGLASKTGRTSLALLALIATGLVTLAELSVAQVPDPSPPTCVSCPKGYHCAHNPERCVPD
ncbi:MAG: hypothetical protein ABTQ29_12720 [Siculibacillus sp.]